MDYRILGPLEVRRDGRPVALGAGRQRALLALLLVERNHPVDVDHIVEELWNGDAPQTATKVVHNLVSQLRRLWPDDVLRTRGHGYELRVPDDALDAVGFERLLDQGRDALARGDSEQARAHLAESLALWRGPALAEFADAPWARAEAARLEDRRLVALERRIDADLALGHHADVIGELERTIAAEPLREGLRGQLMLALYRSGRQAEALAAFRDARRTLVDELGIEPGPALARLHEKILEQHPELDAPATSRRLPRAPPRRAGVLLAAGGVAVLLAAAAAAFVVNSGGSGESGAAAGAAGGGLLVGLDARTGKVTRKIPAGRTPWSLAAAGGRVWMVDGEARTVAAVDPATGDVDTVATGATPTDIAAGLGAVWIANGSAEERGVTLGPQPAGVVRLDAETGQQRTGTLARSGPLTDTLADARIAVSPSGVWALTAAGAVARIEPESATVTQIVARPRVFAIAAGGAGLWAVGANRKVLQLDERTGRVTRRITLPTNDTGTLTVGGDAAWVAGWTDDRLYRIDAKTGAVGSVQIAEGVTDLTASGHDVYAVSPIRGTLTMVDGAAMRVTRSVRLGGEPRSVAADGDTVWVSVTRTAAPVSDDVAGVRPLPPSRCDPVVAGNGGRADVLVVSDLPLQGDARLASVQMARAITFVLREHEFRAGRFRIAYQSCDDALAGTGLFDEAKCAANGRAYARNQDVIGVIGSFNSGCAEQLIPELNRAPGGGVAMVSPLNSYVGLTRGGPGIDVPGVTESLYPTGRRTFARVFPADDEQSAALARLARDRGRRRVFVVRDRFEGYSGLVAKAFARAARRFGVDVVGRVTWEPGAPSGPALARRIAASGAQAVFVSALLNDDLGAVIRTLRKRLGPGVDVMAPDSFAPAGVLRHVVGPTARGIFFTYPGVVTTRLPPAGARFLRRFTRTQSGVTVESFAIFAAQATEVMLDAIARSDGTRASVVSAVFATRLRDQLIGDIEFDARGDLKVAPITIMRVTGGGSPSTIASIGGATVERVDHVSPELVAGG